MLFYPEHRRFKRGYGILRRPLRIILLRGVLLFGFASHCFNAELGAQYVRLRRWVLTRIWSKNLEKAGR